LPTACLHCNAAKLVISTELDKCSKEILNRKQTKDILEKLKAQIKPKINAQGEILPKDN
jgi:hypothetical protein